MTGEDWRRADQRGLDDLARLSAAELRAGYLQKQFSPTEVTDAVAERVELVEPFVHAFAALDLDRAREEAAHATEQYMSGVDTAMLLGIPFAAKDLFDTAGLETAYGSRMFADHTPAVDATAVRLARAAGAILIGKTTTHEFAWGMTLQDQPFGSSLNPWKRDRIPGGSSGGSAIALATHEVPLALGTDSGGSIRVPATFCGVVGLKPTWGLVSVDGVFPLAPSLDHVGPMARTPQDAAMLLAAITGPEEDHGTSQGRQARRTGPSNTSMAGVSVGVCRDADGVSVIDDITRVFQHAVDLVEHLGGRVAETDASWMSGALDVYYPHVFAEGYYTHSQMGLFPARADEYSEDVRGRVERGAKVSLFEYLAATEARHVLRRRLAGLLKPVDVLMTPASGIAPPRVTETHLLKSDAGREAILSFTVVQNLCGLPSCVVRAGFDGEGLPIGIQLTGPPGGEDVVIQTAQLFFDASEPIQNRWPILN